MTLGPWSILSLTDREAVDVEDPGQHFRAVVARGAARPEALAALGGYWADRAAHAFVCGYGAALQRLHATEPVVLTALAATEAKGVHPRAMETKLRRQGAELRLSGCKSFVSLAGHAEWLWVLADEAPATAERKQLRLVRVSPRASGVALARLPDLPFVPEVAHYQVTLDDVPVASGDVLPGDGWSDYVRPFRTLEDTFVMLAVLGYLVRVTEGHGPETSQRAQLLTNMAALLHVASLSPADAATHLLLAEVLQAAGEAVRAVVGVWPESAERQRFLRDLPLLQVAERAREARLARAREALYVARPAQGD
ncbi:MAG: acyl-CoA dehydrogenase family protein [Polyangiaceae bacterium]